MNSESIAKPETYIANPQERVLDIVMTQDELNWKELLYDLVKQEGMDPWNINISRLAKKFLDMLKELKEMDFRISGKMVLASSLLLKIKSEQLINEGITGLDNLINGAEEELLEEDGFEFEQQDLNQFFEEQKKIIPRSPQPRERKVSVFDLVNALEQALSQDLKRQRVLNNTKVDEDKIRSAPKKTFDLSESMSLIQNKLGKLFIKPTTKVYFTDLITEDSKEAKVYTFLPLLHLEKQRKIDMNQEEHFGPIEVLIHNRRL